MEHILVVEDDDSLREVLTNYLRCEGYAVTSTSSAEEALSCMDDTEFSLLLSDLKLPGKNGLQFVEESREKKNAVPVVVMTAYGSIDIAVEAMRLGAQDFITKPFDPEMLSTTIRKIQDSTKAIEELTLAISQKDNSSSKSFLTQCPRVEQVVREAAKVAPLSSSVLILGESGTGKELIARYIHEQSPRRDQPFLPVNCGSMPSDLLESEFFGHEAGSFTGATGKRIGLFEVANNGTIFLDEIGNMPANLQMKLLRTLQESEIKRIGSNQMQKINTRVISATNCNVEDEIRAGTFREDLFYRLSVIVFEIPPLRERPEDIELLTNYFVKHFAKSFEREVPKITKETVSALERYSWPGNVRELENVIERAMIFAESCIAPEHLDLPDDPQTVANIGARSLSELSSAASRRAEIEAISAVLEQTRRNKSRAARILGVSYKTLLNKVKEYDL